MASFAEVPWKKTTCGDRFPLKMKVGRFGTEPGALVATNNAHLGFRGGNSSNRFRNYFARTHQTTTPPSKQKKQHNATTRLAPANGQGSRQNPPQTKKTTQCHNQACSCKWTRNQTKPTSFRGGGGPFLGNPLSGLVHST